VHEIRKLLKDVYYWMKICPEEQGNAVIKIKSLDKMLNNLGSWQDHFIFREKLKYFRNEYLPKGSAELEGIKALEEKSALEQDVLLAKAKSLWRDVVQ
jgi:CHAD domain-containing protein